MRACTSTHLFVETSPEHYKHNEFSSIFLVSSNRDMFQQMYDFAGQAVYSLPAFLASSDWRNPTEYARSAFQYGHRTELGLWEYLKEDSERTKVFNSGMRSLATISDSSKSAGAYPFDEELAKESVTDTDVLVVDVGGGRGQALESIKATFPQLKGRMILQDVQEVIDDARAGGLGGNIEPQVASFFDSQQVKGKQVGTAAHDSRLIATKSPALGAFIYHFRRIFHDWSDDVSRTILQNTVQAMDYRSRVLITDTVVPEMGAPRHVALQDINMMSFAGMERTQSQWKELLEGVGLQVKKFWTYEGNLQNVIEARLKE